jgi:twitching motility protein PilT
MVSMDNSLLALYRQNVISKDTAIIYSSNAELMEKKMARI